MNLQPQDFDYVSAIVREDSAIVLEKGKEYLVEARLTPLAKTQGFESIANLVTALKANALSSKALRQAVVEALTTNETSFFRDIEPFEILKKNVLPELIEKRAAKKQLSLWCAASSTGQEPYTVAMLLREHFPQLVSWKINFQATDLSRDVLERARSGVFSQMEVNRGLPVTYLVKYFDKQGTQWRVKENIRSMITFSELNLIKPFSTLGEQDIVFIRNVLIYFDVPSKREILGKIRKILRPDGYLFLGTAETTLNIDEGFERRAFGKSSCYQKKA